MKTNRLFPVALVVALSCVLPVPSQAKGLEPDAIVKNLYKAHDAKKGPFSPPKKRALIEQYFGKETAALIWKDTATAKGEVGALDFDPLYDSQDPQITNFKVGETHFGGIAKHKGDKPEEGLAVLDVTFKDSGKAVRIGFQLNQDSSKAWKITDIHYPDGRSLRTILRGK
jgi:Protein of unknown function (DUF3828)